MWKEVQFSCVVLPLVFVVFLVGCGDDGRLPVQGKVTVDGVPVENGYIYLTPLPETDGPTTGAKITDGSYKIESGKGVFQGSFQVAIKVWEESKKMTEDFATGEKTKGIQQTLPAKFNTKTELTVEITGDKDSYDFNLKL